MQSRRALDRCIVCDHSVAIGRSEALQKRRDIFGGIETRDRSDAASFQRVRGVALSCGQRNDWFADAQILVQLCRHLLVAIRGL